MRAWLRARASKGRTHWFEELFGRPPDRITAAIARITDELMIREEDLRRLARREIERKHKNAASFADPDMVLKMDPHSGYRWIANKKLAIRFYSS